MELNDVFLVDKFRFRTNEFIKNRSTIETEWGAKTSIKSAFFRGVVSLVGVSNCIKAIAKRHHGNIRTLSVKRTGFVLISTLPKYAGKCRKYREKIERLGVDWNYV